MNRLLFALFFAAATGGVIAGRIALDQSWTTSEVVDEGWKLAIAMWKRWKQEAEVRGKTT